MRYKSITEIGVISTQTAPLRAGRGWSFPPGVRRLLKSECQGKTVLHLFGGYSDFGIRMDIDPSTEPHVVADAWLPPFAKDSFDVVIMDPPYSGDFRQLNNQKRFSLMRAAAWLAREFIYWFHTQWISTDGTMPLVKGWLVVAGRNCQVRCLQKFQVLESKRPPFTHFTRGSAVRYNRWLANPNALPFGESHGSREGENSSNL